MDEAWVAVGLKVHSLRVDDGGSDTCPALSGLNLMRADILPYCPTNPSQNELKGGRSGSLISLSTGYESSPEYLFKGFAGDDQAFIIANLVALLVILVPTLLFVRSRSKQVPAGKTRIRWKCRCGRRLYDDFEELRSGAIAELERSLNKASELTNKVTITRRHDLEIREEIREKVLRMSASEARIEMAHLKLDLIRMEGADEVYGEVPKTDQELPGLKEQVTFNFSDGTFRHSMYDPDRDAEPLVKAPMDRSSTGGTIQSQATGLGNLSPLGPRNISTGSKARSVRSHPTKNMPKEASEAPNPPQPENLFLLLCIPHRKYATRLIHMDVCTLLSDQLFFKNLRSHHRSMRGRWVSVFSLRQLRSIRFVKFEMYPSTLVDIRKIDDIPPETHKDEYRYRPIPAEVIPPVGENHLMHLYHHPEDAEDTAICLDKVPKKFRERLVVCPQRGTGLGWGVHFVEGLHWTKLWILGFIGLLMSIAFGIAWACVRNDVQGGFDIAACMMVGLTFTTGIVGAALEPK